MLKIEKQFECNNITQVARKIAELTNTAIDKDMVKYYCSAIKKSKQASDTFDYVAFDENGKEHDVTIWIGFDFSTKQWLVSRL